MKTKMLPLCAAVAALSVTALSTGGSIYLVLAALLMLMMLAASLSVWRAIRTVKVKSIISEQTVSRGDPVLLTVTVSYRSIIPIAPLTLNMVGGSGHEERRIRLNDLSNHAQQINFPLDAPHVGVIAPGVRTFEIEDMFGLLTLTRRPLEKPKELLILPCLFDVEDLKFAPGDSGIETVSRATEDVNLPAEVRAYQAGDPLKKIHWKLSAKRGSLVVRRFEEPTYPDALVLLDCSPPLYSDDAEKHACMKDTLLETAASVVKHHLNGDHPVRLPLLGTHPFEFDKSMGLQTLMEELARVDFSQTERFERVLLLETRRMRKQGATVIITTRLNSNIVDMVVRIRRMGPYVRVYLVTFIPDDPPMLPLISKLQHNTIEVCYVTPAA
jgi:uncharacterized protein (DUF58 family)